MHSISASIVAPVVVNPETTSNIASISDGISPENTKGSAPKNESKIHESDTIKKPSRA